MPIPEEQLKTWTGLGSEQQSSATYQSIKRVIEHASAPYASRQIDSFLQGSYYNDTNIYGDSDVDIILRTKSFFHYNLDALPEPQKAEFKRIHPTPSEYTLKEIKAEVSQWLYRNYAGDLDTTGKKAFRIKANATRRESDVLVVAPHRRYTSYISGQTPQFVEGVIFQPSDGSLIVNYPKQHSDNMTAKHQSTNGRLKPLVRVLKNMRNKMIERQIIKPGSAPSYFLEGLLYNVPAEHFQGSLQQSVEACFGWINDADHGSFTCANGIHPLSRDNVATSWSIEGYISLLTGVGTLWARW